MVRATLIAASGTDAPMRFISEIISEITSTGFGSGLRTSEVEDGKPLFATRVTESLLIPKSPALAPEN